MNIINEIKKYLSLVKFSHTVFALPFALIGFAIAVNDYGSFEIEKLILIIICMVCARNSAMAFNRWIDRDIDKENERTKNREIPAGLIKAKNALFFVILNVLFFVTATYFINRLCFYLSPVALLVILGYSLTKHFTGLCHFILGLGLSLSPIGAYIAVTGEFKLVPVLLSFIVLLWTGGFDIIYALQDEDFDKDKGLKSIPSILGRKKALIVSAISHLIAGILVFIIGLLYFQNALYMTGAIVFVLILIYQHIIIKPNDISKVNFAFATLNGIASILFAITSILSLVVQ